MAGTQVAIANLGGPVLRQYGGNNIISRTFKFFTGKTPPAGCDNIFKTMPKAIIRFV